MRTIETVVYKFNELNEKSKDFAVKEFSRDYPDYEWWNGVYSDAENIGLKITEFSIDRADFCNGNFIR